MRTHCQLQGKMHGFLRMYWVLWLHSTDHFGMLTGVFQWGLLYGWKCSLAVRYAFLQLCEKTIRSISRCSQVTTCKGQEDSGVVARALLGANRILFRSDSFHLVFEITKHDCLRTIRVGNGSELEGILSSWWLPFDWQWEPPFLWKDGQGRTGFRIRISWLLFVRNKSARLWACAGCLGSFREASASSMESKQHVSQQKNHIWRAGSGQVKQSRHDLCWFTISIRMASRPGKSPRCDALIRIGSSWTQGWSDQESPSKGTLFQIGSFLQHYSLTT